MEKIQCGLLPVENTIMVAIPELDGAISPLVFGGRRGQTDGELLLEEQDHSKTSGYVDRNMTFSQRKSLTFGKKVLKLINLRKLENRDKKVGVVIFNFPPNAVNIGTAAHLDVFSSLYNTLHLKTIGYTS